MVDIRKIHEKIAQARKFGGPRPFLVGYDANGIQGLVTASSRPLAMLGASRIIARFDEEAEKRKGSIFSGGGRGMEIVASEAEARARAVELATHFRKETLIGVMATAFVPYDDAQAAKSLHWLRQKLDIEKDQAPPPGGTLPLDKRDQCADCRMFLARHPCGRKDAPDERICNRCHAMLDAGRKASGADGEKIQSLLDLSPSGRVAAVSSDGNNLGDFFASLRSLEQMAVASKLIGEVFRDARDKALAGLQHERVSLATGGDDIRIFVAAEGLLPYVEALVSAIEQRADKLANFGAPFSTAQLAHLSRMGVGIGAVVADAHFPAARLMEYAHALERSAKRFCRADSARSAFDFAILRAGDASFGSTGKRPPTDGRPFAMDEERWKRCMHQAKALAAIPGAQRSVLAEEGVRGEAELGNLLRYQVARSSKWKEFYKAMSADWCDPEAVMQHRPTPALLDLIRLMQPVQGDEDEMARQP